MSKTALVWFRQDLRLADNPALAEALDTFDQIVPVFLWTPEEEKPWPPGAASRYWLHQSLKSLSASLQAKGSRLILRSGPTALPLIRQLIKDTNAGAVYWNRRYEPAISRRDEAVSKTLTAEGIPCESFTGSLLLEPWESRKKNDTPYRVYTPFANACRQRISKIHLHSSPRSLPPVPQSIHSDSLESLQLEPRIPWAAGIAKAWTPGESGAGAALRHFIKQGLATYEKERNHPANNNGVSRLSPYLHFGEISPRQVWCAVKEATGNLPPARRKSADVYLSEILWREFSHHLLHHFPDSPEQPLRQEFTRYPWQADKAKLKAWQQGNTGYPIVDAGMRQLWQTGWMHNRVRMIVGSFLIKDLGIAWQTGKEWFWDTLVDADLAQNAMNWQWVAGCGADASPFFRIFNPITQGQKFDPDGAYVREFVPELAKLPAKWIHSPFTAPDQVLTDAGVTLGETYPHPIVDHAAAREQALDNYKSLRK